MTNQVAIRAHTEHGDAVLFDKTAHVYLLEGGTSAAFAGILPRLLPGVRGIFTPEDVKIAIGRAHPFVPETIAAPIRLLCVENTHNIGGGSVWPLGAVNAVAQAGRAAGLALHLDGARLWHASVAAGVPESSFAAPFDTVSVCFSKALGAPVGSCLAGPTKFVSRARRFKQQIGGGMRQAGIIAAGALYALHHHRPQLHETHTNARRFADGLTLLSGVDIDPAAIETNIVRFRLRTADAAAFVDEAHRRGVHMLPAGPDAVRAVFYLDITAGDVDRALQVVADVLRSSPKPIDESTMVETD
jgi:threonine aldolase